LLASLLRNDDAGSRQLPNPLDQFSVIDPHGRAEQDWSKRPEPPPSTLSQVDEVVDAVNESSEDVKSEERAIAIFRSDAKLIVEFVGEPPYLVRFVHAARVTAARRLKTGKEGQTRGDQPGLNHRRSM
jgi:hypothetical protein